MQEQAPMVVHSLAGVRDLLPLAAANPQRYPGLLESAAQGPHARYDLLFAFPRSTLTLHRDGRVRDEQGGDCGAKFLEALDAAWQAERDAAIDQRVSILSTPSSALPFHGGWLLFLSYELGAEIEPRLRLPAAPEPAIPLALALRCPAAIVVDRIEARTHLVVEQGSQALLDTLRADLDAVPAFACRPLPSIAIDDDAPERFLLGVDAVQEYLRAGDVFQVNLSREWRARFAAAVSPAQVFASLRRANPAPFAGLLQWQDWALLSSSPERLVTVRGNRISTRPIAGTRPRSGGGDDDAARLRELISHPKERAEHVMLIDLERNDLGRVCMPGSVIVDELMTLESYAHVHHIVSNVSGNLRAGVSPGAVIRAVFPGGTITGCPKVRTMEIIAELEGAGRGAYTGSLGYLDRGGDLDLNILIRTLTMFDGALRFRAGAGIVTDSVAIQELEETRAKARGLLRALGDAA